MVGSLVVREVSELQAPADVVWEHATSMAGINAELTPVRMSVPDGIGADAFAGLAAELPLGVPLFTSTVSLWGIPFDRHRLVLESWGPGRSFQEDSSSLLHRSWRHRRTVEPGPDGGSVLTDVVEVVPRLPGARVLVRPVVAVVFRRRHRWLREHFGSG